MIRRPKTTRRRLHGLSLVEASVGVAVVGSALAVFVPVFFRELRTSRIAEAPQNLARLHAGAATYFAAAHTDEDGTSRRRCLPAASGRAPRAPAAHAQSVQFQEESSPGAATFAALDFEPGEPVYYSYEVSPTRAGCDIEGEGPLLTLRAYGDLDGDGDESTFERVSAASADGTTLVSAGALHVRRRTE